MARRGGYAKGAISRELILDRAVELFGEIGYSAASLRDVARHSGMTHSGLLHHFPNKEALLTGVLERRERAQYSRFVDRATSAEEPIEGLFELIERSKQDVAGVRLFNMLATEATSQKHPANDYFVHRYRHTYELVKDLFQKAKETGTMQSDTDPGSLARMAIALMDGLQLQWLLEGSQAEEQEAPEPCPLDELAGLPAATCAAPENNTDINLAVIFADFLKILGVDLATSKITEAAHADLEAVPVIS